jgi:hypothetical protein
MIRAIALSLALLLGIGTIIPLATDYSEARVKHSHKKKKVKKYKKYSKMWWKQYHKRMKKRKAIAARKRALRVRQILLARARKAKQKLAVAKLETENTVVKNEVAETPVVKNEAAETPVVKNEVPAVVPTPVPGKSRTKNLANKVAKTPKLKQTVAAGQDSVQAMLPTGEIAPQGWKRGKADNEYQVDGDDGRTVGTASISDVGPVAGEDSGRKTLGGVPTSALRRTVIDKMVREEGWVVNDFQKEINGQKVYVVVAQSPGKGGGIQSRIFYFTESNGRIYSLATNSSIESAEKLAKDSERILNSFRRKIQSADLR